MLLWYVYLCNIHAFVFVVNEYLYMYTHTHTQHMHFFFFFLLQWGMPLMWLSLVETGNTVNTSAHLDHDRKREFKPGDVAQQNSVRLYLSL